MPERNPTICTHGQLARSCSICERDEEIAELREQVRRALTERDAMREALRPFAQVADVIDFYVADAVPQSVEFPLPGVRMDDEGPGRVTLTPDDFQCARAALARLDAGKGQQT